MTINTIDFWKKFLFKCFIIGFVFNFVFFIWWLLVRDFAVTMAYYFFELDKAAYYKMVVNFFAISKFAVFYVFLIPSLALFWISKCQKGDWKKNIKLDED